MRIVVNGLVEAMRWLAGLVLLSAACAGAWVAVRGGPYGPRLGWALMGVGGIILIGGPGMLTRHGGADGFAFLGRGPEMGDGDSGSLTGTGLALLVGLPLLIGGGLLV